VWTWWVFESHLYIYFIYLSIDLCHAMPCHPSMPSIATCLLVYFLPSSGALPRHSTFAATFLSLLLPPLCHVFPPPPLLHSHVILATRLSLNVNNTQHGGRDGGMDGGIESTLLTLTHTLPLHPLMHHYHYHYHYHCHYHYTTPQ
jgi:hypothetical protein